MGEITLSAQSKVKTGEDAYNYRVRIGPLELARGDEGSLLKSASIAYDVASGTSEATIATSENIASLDLINEPVNIKVGYGRNLLSWFDGDLASVEPPDEGLTYSAQAWGPFKQMTGEVFGHPSRPHETSTDYRNWTIREFFYDLFKRAGYRNVTLEVRSRRNFYLRGEDVRFPIDRPLEDAARFVADSAGYVFCDMPGKRRLLMPRPVFGATGKPKAVYRLGTYYKNTFRAVSETRRRYGAVLIFRRGEQGAMDFPPVWTEVPQSGARVRGLKPFVIPDFVGDREDAVEEGARLAEILNSLYACEFTQLPFNSELSPYDTIETDDIDWRDTGGRRLEPYEVRYSWVLDSQLSGTIDTNGVYMSLAGSGIRIRERAMRVNHYFTDSRRSPYVVGV